jgi:hypothetical protein
MTEPKLIWYWDKKMIAPDDRAFHWTPATFGPDVYVVKCRSSVGNANWNVCRVEFPYNATASQIQQTMDTLLDVCRMRYADELLNQGEMK